MDGWNRMLNSKIRFTIENVFTVESFGIQATSYSPATVSQSKRNKSSWEIVLCAGRDGYVVMSRPFHADAQRLHNVWRVRRLLDRKIVSVFQVESSLLK